MTTPTGDGPAYKLPGGLNQFQGELYRHLIKWKWQYITREPGVVRKTKDGEVVEYSYDAILPAEYQRNEQWPHLYPSIVETLKDHRKLNDFRIHNHFYHMASSQAANLNLFLPLLGHPQAAAILQALKPDFAALATDQLDRGYCVEYWGGNFDKRRDGIKDSLLGDKTEQAGTDADIAIAYYNHQKELCLWLVEHKLTEREFTNCGGFKSGERRKQQEKYTCTCSFAEILADKGACYYHSAKGYKYWNITERHPEIFVGCAPDGPCPFKGGLNQLWRNQLLALAIEDQGTFKHVTFSVVRHPKNTTLNMSLIACTNLIGHNPTFSACTSLDVVQATERLGDPELAQWASWYRELYMI